MARNDDKFAWPKAHAVNDEIRAWLRAGAHVEYDKLVRATDPDQAGDAAMVSFRTASAGSEKGDYVIFQYGLVIEDQRGRVAVFGRVEDDKGYGCRNLSGHSILVSGSRMMTPTDAIESILNEKLSFGRGDVPGTIEPVGFALNVQARREGVERADYLFCLFRLRMTTNRLNGLVRETPDSFEWWRDPHAIDPNELDGPVDRMVLENLCQAPQPKPGLEGPVWYQPGARLGDGRGAEFPLTPFVVPGCRTVFISHDAEAQFKAFLLRDVMVRRSRHQLFPFLDIHEVFRTSGDFWPRIESMVQRSDILLVLVTEGTASSHGVAREIDHALGLPQPPEIVVLRVDGSIDDVPHKLRSMNIHDYTGRQYRLWHQELDGLIELLRRKPFRPGTLDASDPR